MKVIVQIPCLNEEQTLPATIRDIPRTMPGVDSVEILIIDDGSTDRTVEVARALGVDHVVRFRRNRGLAAAFSAGIDACLRLGADIIVNTDGDNQYVGADIPRLIAPVLDGEADMVIGDRQVQSIEHFSPAKKRLQRVGSWVVRKASNTDVPDTTSGFRAFSREAALRVHVLSDYSYTLETVIQAGMQRLAIAHLPVRTNPKLRESRLFDSMAGYIRRSAQTISRIYVMYEPLRVFVIAGTLLSVIGAALIIRYLRFMVMGEGRGHVQSVIVAGSFLLAGVTIGLIGVVADLLATNRRLSEDILLRVKRMELELGGAGRSPERDEIARERSSVGVADVGGSGAELGADSHAGGENNASA